MNQTEISLKNTECMLERAELKIELLSGCPCFGDSDGMNGSCQECYHEDRIQFNRCVAFEYALREYKSTKGEPKEKADDIPPISNTF